MTIIVCISDGMGMTFNNRRQSRDREVIRDIESLLGDSTLYISDFSKKLFSESKNSVVIEENPLINRSKDDFVFIESISLKPYIDQADRMVLYHWGEAYPADTFLDTPPAENGFSLKSSVQFKGYSHENITREIWER